MALVGRKLTRENVKGFPGAATCSYSGSKRCPELVHDGMARKERDFVDRLLRGKIALGELPPERQRVFRVFVATNFSDMQEEQVALAADAFPKLRQYCRERYAIDFQAVDMENGMRRSSCDDPWDMDTYFQALDRTQQRTIDGAPYLLVMLGQKYGKATLPSSISHSVFETLRDTVQDRDKKALIDKWFIKNSNVSPARCVLQKPVDVLEKDDLHKWPEVEAELLSIFQPVDVEGLERTTESAIDHVLCRTPTKDLCIFLDRQIVDMKRYMDRVRITEFTDMIPGTNKQDTERQEALECLRDNWIQAADRRCVLRHRIEWNEPAGVDSVAHAKHLDDFSTQVFNTMRAQIDEAMIKQSEVAPNPVVGDVIQTWQWARWLSGRLVGRDSQLEQIMEYIQGDSRQALVVHGPPGCGLSSVMAGAAALSQSFLTSRGSTVNTTVILRHCGRVPSCTNLSGLLRGLCSQIAYATNQDSRHMPTNYQGLKQYFMQLSQSAEFRGLVIIFLDGIHHLTEDDHAHRMDWLPARLSNNVKIIVSTTPEHKPTWTSLRQKLTMEEDYIDVGQLKPSLCYDILNTRLRNQGRSITFHQWRLVKETFAECSLPLLIDGVFDEVSTWTSADDTESLDLHHTVMTLFESKLDKLETRHGVVLVQHVLGLLCASDRGLSEVEIEDILSLDETILDDLSNTHGRSSSVRRFPSRPLHRLLHDLQEHLVTRTVDETTVLVWKHSVYNDVATRRYIRDGSDHARKVHNMLADFYLGKWSGMKPKPKGEPLVMNGHKGNVRYVLCQPDTFRTFNNTERFNYRKLEELPKHLFLSKRFKELKELTLFNYSWLLTKIKCCGPSGVLPDYRLLDERDTRLVAGALAAAETVLQLEPNLLAAELSGRLLPYYPTLPSVRRLLDEADTSCMSQCPLLPVWQTYPSPGTPLQYIHKLPPGTDQQDVYLLQPDGDLLLVTKPRDGSAIRLWSPVDGQHRPSVDIPALGQIYPTPSNRFLIAFPDENTVERYRLENGKTCNSVSYNGSHIQEVAVSERFVVIAMETSPGPVVIEMVEEMVLERLNYQCNMVAISRGEEMMVCSSGLSLIVHQLPLLQRRCTIPTKHRPVKAEFTVDPHIFLVQYQNQDVQLVTINTLQKTSSSVQVLRDLELQDWFLSNTGNLLLARASRSLYVYDMANKELRHHLQDLPTNIFIENLSTFTAAAFNSDESLVLGARQSYVAVWETQTGDVLRILQASVSLITKMFVSSSGNMAVSINDDGTTHSWNLDNLDCDVQYTQRAVEGPVQCMAVSPVSGCVLVTSNTRAEARLISSLTGQCQHVLKHDDDISLSVEEVMISRAGGLGVTRLYNRHTMSPYPWSLLREDKLWDLKTGQDLLTAVDSRYVVFSPTDDKVAFFICVSCNPHSWHSTQYQCIVYSVTTKEESYLTVSRGEIIGQPLLIAEGNILCYLLQSCQEDPHNGTDRHIELCAHSFSNSWRGAKYIPLQNVWSGVSNEDNYIDARAYNGHSLLLTYGKRFTGFSHKADGSVDRSRVLYKGALIYDLQKDCLLKKFESAFSPDTDMDTVITSQQSSVYLDGRRQVFDGTTGTPIAKLKFADQLKTATLRFLLDGRYMIGISRTGGEVLIYRTSDQVCVGRVFAHGVATHLEVGSQGRMVFVGCDDGRIMTFVLTLDSPDPKYEIIRHLPSRASDVPRTRPSTPLDCDMEVIKTTENEHRQKSALARSDIAALRCRPVGYRAVTERAMLSSELNKVHSQSCCLQ